MSLLNNKDRLNEIATYLKSLKIPNVKKKEIDNLVNELGENILILIINNDKKYNLNPFFKDIFFNIKKNIQENINEYFCCYLLIFFPLTFIDYMKKINSSLIKDILTTNPYKLLYYTNIEKVKDIDDFLIHKNDDSYKHLKNITIAHAIIKKISFIKGNCLLTKEEIFSQIKKKFNCYEVFIEKLLEEKLILKYKDYYVDVEYFNFVEELCIKLNQIKQKNYKKDNIKESDKIIDIIEKEINFKYTNKQKEIIIDSLNNNVLLINGIAGSGKTTIINGIVNIHKKKLSYTDEDIVILAPTGKASKRAREITNINSFTIHSYLGLSEEHSFHNIKNKKKLNIPKLIIIDESSMLEEQIIFTFFKMITKINKIIFVGDSGQLPPIGMGNFFNDLLELEFFKKVELKESLRQRDNNIILDVCNNVNEGNITDIYFQKSLKYAFSEVHPRNFYDKLKRILFFLFDKGFDYNQIQLLCPIYKGYIGINSLNDFISNNYDLNKINDHYNLDFKIGDKVMITKNFSDLNLHNGDIGFIKNITLVNSKKKYDVIFSDELITLSYKYHKYLQLAYCISVHKSQGSEFDFVILPIFDNYKIMLNRKILYTALSRAKKGLYILGDKLTFLNSITKNKKIEDTLLKLLLKKNNKKDIYTLINNKEIDEDINGITPWDFMN